MSDLMGMATVNYKSTKKDETSLVTPVYGKLRGGSFSQMNAATRVVSSRTHEKRGRFPFLSFSFLLFLIDRV